MMMWFYTVGWAWHWDFGTTGEALYRGWSKRILRSQIGGGLYKHMVCTILQYYCPHWLNPTCFCIELGTSYLGQNVAFVALSNMHVNNLCWGNGCSTGLLWGQRLESACAVCLHFEESGWLVSCSTGLLWGQRLESVCAVWLDYTLKRVGD